MSKNGLMRKPRRRLGPGLRNSEGKCVKLADSDFDGKVMDLKRRQECAASSWEMRTQTRPVSCFASTTYSDTVKKPGGAITSALHCQTAAAGRSALLNQSE